MRNSPMKTMSVASACGASSANSSAVTPLCTTRTNAARRADLGGERIAAVAALEQEQLGAPHQHLLEREIQKADRRMAAVMQAAAMRRVDPDRAAAAEPRIGATLGAVAVQDVGTGLARALSRHVALCRHIAQADMAAHRHAGQPERQLSGQRRERRIRPRAAGRGIRHDADLMAARRLRARQIDHVTKQAADGRPQDVQDIEGLTPGHVPRTSVRRF